MQSFDWDPVKAKSNLRKHGVSFLTAILAFTDPFAHARPERVQDSEQRWQTIGSVGGELLLLVVHTTSQDTEDETVEIIRIISARQANPRERRIYEQENG